MADRQTPGLAKPFLERESFWQVPDLLPTLVVQHSGSARSPATGEAWPA